MKRRITIHLHENETTGEPMTAEEYTDLANAFWMFLRSTPFYFEIEPDPEADTHAMDAAWTQYGHDASWND